MYDRIREFFLGEDGAVTVDWVVLTAGAAFISVGILAGIQDAVTDKSEGIGADVLREGSEALTYNQNG